MKKTYCTIVALTVVASGCAMHGGGMHGRGVGAPPHMQQHSQYMQEMDANKDGVASRDEFMKFHEAMFDRMKNKDGVIDLNAMRDHCGPTARDARCGPVPKHGG